MLKKLLDLQQFPISDRERKIGFCVASEPLWMWFVVHILDSVLLQLHYMLLEYLSFQSAAPGNETIIKIFQLSDSIIGYSNHVTIYVGIIPREIGHPQLHHL